jgi:hypothetical protein
VYAVFDELDSLSPAQLCHAQTYATGLVAASNKTVAGIARQVLPANGNRALNKFITEYDRDVDQSNRERFEEHGETRWSKDGYIPSPTRSLRNPGTMSPESGASTVTRKMTLSGVKILFTFSKPTTKPLTR